MFRRKDNIVHRVLLQLRWKSSMHVEKTRFRSKKMWIVSYLCWKYVTPPPFWYFPKFLQECTLLFKLGKFFLSQNGRISSSLDSPGHKSRGRSWFFGMDDGGVGGCCHNARTELKSTGVRRHSNEVFPAIKTPWAEQPHRPQLQRWWKRWHILW